MCHDFGYYIFYSVNYLFREFVKDSKQQDFIYVNNKKYIKSKEIEMIELTNIRFCYKYHPRIAEKWRRKISDDGQDYEKSCYPNNRKVRK